MISQQTFFIPPEIQAGLAVGDLIQYGGIVRNQAGQIVKHLKVIDIPVDIDKAAAAVLKLIKDPKVFAGAAVVAVAAAGAGAVAVVRKRKKSVPECVARYNAALGAYLGAVRTGTVEAQIIDGLLSALDSVVAYSDEGGSIALDFSTDQAALLVKLVVDSTKQLAKDNSLELEELHEPTAGTTAVDFRRYLEVQRRLFAEAV